MDDSTRQATRLWTLAQPKVSAFVTSVVRDFKDRDDVLQDIAVAVIDSFDSYDESRPFDAWALGIAIGLKHHDEKNPRKFMADMVDEPIDTTTQAVLGLTVACARCHDHKYDPIPTADYYALAGIFQCTQTYYGTSRIAQNHRPSDLLLLPIPDESTGAVRNQKVIADLKERIAKLDREIVGFRGKDRREIRNARNRIAAQLSALNPDGSPKTFGMGV